MAGKGLGLNNGVQRNHKLERHIARIRELMYSTGELYDPLKITVKLNMTYEQAVDALRTMRLRHIITKHGSRFKLDYL